MIYFNGDSHTNGYGVELNQRYSHHVATYFNHASENHSQGGASNQRILRTTREYLQTQRPDLIVIGWTTWEREEWTFNNQFYNVNSSGYDALPAELEEEYRLWVSKQNEDSLKIKSDYWHNEIWKFHQELSDKSINHVFFNCMYNFFDVDNQHNWNHSFIGPYDNNMSYYWYLQSHGYTTDHLYHYKSDGHKQWATVLIDFIESNKLL